MLTGLEHVLEPGHGVGDDDVELEEWRVGTAHSFDCGRREAVSHICHHGPAKPPSVSLGAG